MEKESGEAEPAAEEETGEAEPAMEKAEEAEPAAEEKAGEAEPAMEKAEEAEPAAEKKVGEAELAVKKKAGAGKGKRMYQKIVTGIFLLLCAYTDLKTHCVYRRTAVAAAAAAAAGHLAANDMGAAACLLSLLPGACCFLISLLTREQLGYGDSLVITVCGFSLGMEEVTGLLMTGFFLAALWAVGLCVFFHADRKKEIPLMPFLVAAFLLCVWIK